MQEQPGSLGHVDLTKTGGRLYMVPKELWRLVEHINTYGKDKVRRLSQLLQPLTPHSLRSSVAAALVLYIWMYLSWSLFKSQHYFIISFEKLKPG